MNLSLPIYTLYSRARASLFNIFFLQRSRFLCGISSTGHLLQILHKGPLMVLYKTGYPFRIWLYPYMMPTLLPLTSIFLNGKICTYGLYACTVVYSAQKSTVQLVCIYSAVYCSTVCPHFHCTLQ